MNTPLFTKKQIALIITPLLFQNLLSMTIGMIDSVMVASVGEEAFAGVSLVTFLDTLLITFFSSVTSGGMVVLSQSLGAGDKKRATEASKQLLYTAFAVAFAISAVVLVLRVPILDALFGKAEMSVMQNALDYFTFVAMSFPFLAIDYSVAAMFRAQGDSMIAMKVALLNNAINIAGNALLIYGFGLGAMGAAISTLFSRAVGAVLIVIIGHRKTREIHLHKLFSFRPDKDIIKDILSIGVPNGVENSLFQFGRLMTSSLVSTFTTAAVSANAAALSLANFQYTAGGAIQNSMITVVGRCVGAKDKKQAKQYTLMLLGIGYALVIVVCTITCLFSTPLLKLYNLSPESLTTAKNLLFFHNIVSCLIWGVAFILPPAFRAASDVRFTMIVSVFSMWVFRVAFAHYLARSEISVFGLFTMQGMDLGIYGVWIAMATDWVFRTILFVWRFVGGKWLTKYKGFAK